MRSPYCIGVWKPTLQLAAQFVSDYHLGNNVIQFVPNVKNSSWYGAGPMPGFSDNGYWIMLRVNGDQRKAIIETPGAAPIIG